MRLLISTLFILIMFTACVTNKPLLLTSPMHYQIPTSITPSLSVPVPGIHPYIGLFGGFTNNNTFDFLSTDSRTVSAKNLGLNTGFIFQPDMQKDYNFGFFGSLNVSGMYSSCSINWSGVDVFELPKKEKELLSEKSSDFSSELNTRLGVVGKLRSVTLGCYFNGFCDYETGKYYNFRKEVDGIEYFYNISNQQFVYGCGLGFDLAVGKINQFDVGLIYEIRQYFTNSQTFESSEEEYDHDVFGSYVVNTVVDGSKMTFDKMKIEPYIDYEKLRFSCAINLSNITFSTTYRW